MSDLQTNIEKLNGYLARFKETGVLNRTGGQALPANSGKTFENHLPVDETFICNVVKSDETDINAAAKAARDALVALRQPRLGRCHPCRGRGQRQTETQDLVEQGIRFQ